MINYKRDDFDESLEDIMKSINEILNEKEQVETINCDNVIRRSEDE